MKCSHCNKELISENYYEWCLKLSNQYIIPNSCCVIDINIQPILYEQTEYFFCNIGCLHGWSKTILEHSNLK